LTQAEVNPQHLLNRSVEIYEPLNAFEVCFCSRLLGGILYRRARGLLGAPARLARFADGIGGGSPEVLQCGVIESKELATLVSTLLPIQQGRH
jgi:hypothetical protein